MLSNSNRNLARDKIWSWAIPAYEARLPDGRTVRTSPSAGVCAEVCYARNGSYNYPNVRSAHLRNLLFVLEDPAGWEAAMMAELAAPRFVGSYVRVHDAGDYFSDRYVLAWLRIMRANPQTFFYSYTKEVRRFERLVEPDPPPNSRWICSLGGTQDERLDVERHRVADVFAAEQDIERAGFHSQRASDLLAAFGPAPVGMAATRSATFKSGRETGPSANGSARST
ncbi:hypothetical protein ABZ897_50660 [Nonomuraea sp. NPDC046802]|uniref:GP88 family protein n=1 Tax=Nonomuraea sp. NPDC046802 TaxID=3154919 RepID=UPI0033FF9613